MRDLHRLRVNVHAWMVSRRMPRLALVVRWTAFSSSDSTTCAGPVIGEPLLAVLANFLEGADEAAGADAGQGWWLEGVPPVPACLPTVWPTMYSTM